MLCIANVGLNFPETNIVQNWGIFDWFRRFGVRFFLEQRASGSSKFDFSKIDKSSNFEVRKFWVRPNAIRKQVVNSDRRPLRW